MTHGFIKYSNGEEAKETQLIAYPKARHYILLFGVYEDENGKWQWKRDYYGDKPTRATVKADIEALVNGITDERILSGFVWRDNPVWLSSENQFNFKCAYDLAYQTGGASLPARYKLGEDEKGDPVYFDFKDLETFSDFYLGCIAWIQKCINDGWEAKDGVNYDKLFNN